MRACVILGVEDLRIAQREVPTIGTHDVLVRVRAPGICGSDLHYYFEGRNGDFVIRKPFVPGHEFAGEAAETGPAVSQVRAGDPFATTHRTLISGNRPDRIARVRDIWTRRAGRS